MPQGERPRSNPRARLSLYSPRQQQLPLAMLLLTCGKRAPPTVAVRLRVQDLLDGGRLPHMQRLSRAAARRPRLRVCTARGTPKFASDSPNHRTPLACPAIGFPTYDPTDRCLDARARRSFSWMRVGGGALLVLLLIGGCIYCCIEEDYEPQRPRCAGPMQKPNRVGPSRSQRRLGGGGSNRMSYTWPLATTCQGHVWRDPSHRPPCALGLTRILTSLRAPQRARQGHGRGGARFRRRCAGAAPARQRSARGDPQS